MHKKDFNPFMLFHVWEESDHSFIIILYGTNQVFDVEIKPYLTFPSRFRACQKSFTNDFYYLRTRVTEPRKTNKVATISPSSHLLLMAKGQLISECLFDILNFPKNKQKVWKISASESKKRSNHKITAPYSVLNTLSSPFIHNFIRKCLHFVYLTTF